MIVLRKWGSIIGVHWRLALNDSANISDIARLETLAKESYNVMAALVTNCGCEASLIYLKRFIKRMRSQKESVFTFRGQKMGFHVFPFISDLIIRHCTILMPTMLLDDNAIVSLIKRYHDFPEMLQLPLGRKNLDRYVPEWYIRTAFEQLSLQEMTSTLIPRALYYFREIPRLNPKRHRKFIKVVDEVIDVQFRVNLDDLLLCAFSLGAIANTADRFKDILSTDMRWMKPYIESDAMPIVRSHLTLSRDDYIRHAKSQFSGSYTYIRTEPQTILSYPIINLGEYDIVTDPHLLLARVTKHLHDSVYQYFIDNNRIQEYSSAFGEVFKDYIGILLKECYGCKNVFDLDEIDILEGRRADWLVIAGDHAGIFECKAQRYPKDLKRTGSLDILSSFFSERIGSALEQVNATESQWQKITDTIPQVKKAINICKIIVLEEHFQFANVVADFLPNNSIINEIKKSKTHIASTLDLETVLCSNYSSDFAHVFADWFGNLAESPTLEQHVRKLPKFNFNEDNILDRTFNNFFHTNHK